MLTEFDHAVIRYAESRGETSEEVYERITKMEPQGYRGVLGEQKLMEKLHKLQDKETTTYNLSYGIEVKVNGKAGSITSTLKNSYEFDSSNDELAFNLAVDAMESLILAHACAGINVASDEYSGGVVTAVDALLDHCT